MIQRIIPRIISVDDHVIEPGHVFTSYLPSRFADLAPRIVRARGTTKKTHRTLVFKAHDDGPETGDCWSFEGTLYPITGGAASSGRDRSAVTNTAVTFDDMLPAYCEGSHRALADWLCSGVLGRFTRLKVALSEGQIGWIPFMLERMDYSFHAHRHGRGTLDALPSSYYPGRIYGCVVDDRVGMRLRDLVGMDQIMFECDFPHGDFTWPDTMASLSALADATGLSDDELYKLARGNAIACHGLQRFGITV
jgi:hypothetical protein